MNLLPTSLAEMKSMSVLSEKSVLISTYALCGFANFSSIAIQIAVLGWRLIRLIYRDWFTGTMAASLATMMTPPQQVHYLADMPLPRQEQMLLTFCSIHLGTQEATCRENLNERTRQITVVLRHLSIPKCQCCGTYM